MARRQIRTLTPTELARVQQGVLVRIVDDDASLRDALRFVLETEGWRVVDYRSANDFFRGDAPSVRGCVVMDVRMPGLTGIEAQAVMNERGFSLPVIFLTGHGDIDMAVMALHEGAADFIQKPVDNERLLAVIASTAFESLSGAGAVLTNRERDIARLVAEGLTNRLIGERLSIAVRTVEVHRASALRKLGVRTPEEVRAVLEAGA
ncbi:MAG: response regulator transcription factor [Sutterella wadsworthensis]|mgnify:CR=1 FL=1|jgi:transcriptional regulatory protein fixJ